MKNNETKRCVIYARGNNQESIDEQLRFCKEFISANGNVYVGEYTDIGVSGSNNDGVQLQKMLCDSRRKKFDMVVAYKLDRLSRDLCNAIFYVYKLSNKGIGFDCVNKQ